MVNAEELQIDDRDNQIQQKVISTSFLESMDDEYEQLGVQQFSPELMNVRPRAAVP
jgi:hypothetical protein